MFWSEQAFVLFVLYTFFNFPLLNCIAIYKQLYQLNPNIFESKVFYLPTGREGKKNNGCGSSVSLSIASKQFADDSLETNEEFNFKRITFRAKEKIQKTCTLELLKRRLPFLLWAPTYPLGFLIYDFLAGFTAALTGIPQGIACGAVAGVPVEVHLVTYYDGRLMMIFVS